MSFHPSARPETPATSPFPPPSRASLTAFPFIPSSATPFPPQSVKAEAVSKGTDVTGSATVNYAVDKDFTADLTVNQDGVVKAVVAHSGIVDGLKTTVTAEPMNLKKSLKIANAFLQGDLGVKADVSGVLGVPKVDASACYNLGDAQVGAEATVNAKGVSAYAVAAQTKIDDVVAAVILADKMETVKVSASVKLDAATSAAAEVAYKLKGGDAKLTAGASTKLDNGHTLRLVLSSAGHAQCTYGGEISKGLNGTLCAQVDKALKYKYGVQGVYKM